MTGHYDRNGVGSHGPAYRPGSLWPAQGRCDLAVRARLPVSDAGQLFPDLKLKRGASQVQGEIEAAELSCKVGIELSGQLIVLPFIFPNEQVAHKVLDGEAGKMVLAKLDKLQIVGLAISEGGFRHMINNVRPVNTPEDTKGIKFRVMTTPIYIALFQSLGSNAVPLPWGEVFTAMQQKVVDGLEIPLSVIYANKFYEVAKYLSLTNHTYSPLILMCSEQRWKKFSSEEKEIFKRSAYEATVYARNEAKGINEDILKTLKAAGMVINDVSNKKPFQDAVRPMYKQFEEEIGKEVLQAVLNASDAASK